MNYRTRLVAFVALVLLGLVIDLVAGGASVGNLLVLAGVVGVLAVAFTWARDRDQSDARRADVDDEPLDVTGL